MKWIAQTKQNANFNRLSGFATNSICQAHGYRIYFYYPAFIVITINLKYGYRSQLRSSLHSLARSLALDSPIRSAMFVYIRDVHDEPIVDLVHSIKNMFAVMKPIRRWICVYKHTSIIQNVLFIMKCAQTKLF